MKNDTQNLFAQHLAEQGGHDLVITRAEYAEDLVRLRTQVKRLFVLNYRDELEVDGRRFDGYESERGTSVSGMMCEIATLCGLLEDVPHDAD